MTRAFDADRTRREPAVVWLTFLGFGLAFVFTLFTPERILAPGPIPGVSVVLLPAILAYAMQIWGWSRASRRQPMSHVATWYGGAALGTGLAFGRLITMQAITESALA